MLAYDVGSRVLGLPSALEVLLELHKDQIAEHPARIVLGEARGLAARVKAIKWRDPDSVGPDYAGAVSATVEDVISRLDLADPRLITGEMLSIIEGPTTRLRNSLRDVWNHRTLDLMEVARSHAEVLRLAALSIPPVMRPPGPETTDDIDSRLMRLDSELRRLERNGNAVRSRTEEQVDASQSMLEALSSRTQDVLASMEARFVNAQESRSDRFSEHESALRDEFRSALSELRAEWEANAAEASLSVASVASEADHLLEEAQRVLGFSAAASTHTAADAEADRQKDEANKWRWVGVISLALAATYTIVIVLTWGPSGEPTMAGMLWLVVSRLSFTGFMAAIGAYAFRESAQHRARERDQRQAAIDIETFRPFLTELPEDERNEEIRYAARRQFFRNADYNGDQPT